MPRLLPIVVALALCLSLPTTALAVDPPTSSVPEAYASVENTLEPSELGVAEPGELAWDPTTSQLVVADVSGRVAAVSPTGAPGGSRARAVLDALRADEERKAAALNLAALGGDPDTLAIAPDGRSFVYAPATAILYELDASGQPLTQRDLSGAGIDDATSMTVAPSADSTDPLTEQAVYISDAGTTDGSGAELMEIALVEPQLDTMAIAAATTSVTLVNTINTGSGSAWTPDSPDPSGLAYIASGANVPSTMRDRLVSADGEVDETTGAGWNNVNVWFAPRTGSAQTATMNTVQNANPTNNEPVGAAYDSARNELYLCKDGSNGRVWVYDMSGTTPVQVRSFTVTGAPYNNADVEGLAFDSARNILYMVDAIDNDLLKVTKSGVIGTGGETVTNYDLQQYGQSEPEGLDVDPATGNIWVVSNKVSGKGVPDPMIEVSPTGALVSSVSIAAANPNSAGGLAIAPASTGSGMNIYVADRGVDNNDVPTENDGKIFEFSTGGSGGGGIAPVANFTSQQASGTFAVQFTDTSTNSPTSWSWDFGDPTTSGDTSNAQNPSYTYPAANTYQVTLTATNDFGTNSVTKTITVTDASTPPPTTNLLQNGSFEAANSSGQPTSWRTNAGFTRSNAITAVEGTFVGQHASTANQGWNVYQQVPVTAGQTYRFSGKVNIPDTTDAFKFQVRIQWRGSSNTIVTLRKFTSDTDGAWVTVSSASLVAPAGATAARIQMVPGSLNGTIYVDDFAFSVSP